MMQVAKNFVRPTNVATTTSDNTVGSTATSDLIIDVPRPVHRLVSYVQNHAHVILVLLMFVVAVLLRLGLVSLNPGFPAAVMAADPVYHVTVVDGIKESGQWMYNPWFAAFGVEKSINQQPPLIYLDAAMVSLASGLPSWTVLYFLVALMGGLRTVLVYLLSERLFRHQHLALLAAGLTVLPLPPQVWLYETYIGFWIQVVSLTFLLVFLWCLLRYVECRGRWALLGVSFSAVGMMLSHPQELFLIAPAVLYVIWRVVSEQVPVRDRVVNLGFLGVVPGVCFVLLLPWFLYVWKSSSYSFMFNANPFPSDYLAGITTPSLWLFPWWYLVLAGLGFLFIVLQWKKYKEFLVFFAYFGFFLFVLPFALKSPYYLGRVKVLLPVLLAPLVAFVVAALIDAAHRIIPRLSKTMVCVVLCALVVLPGWSVYSALRASSVSVVTDQNAWNSFVWLRENTPANSTVLFMSGCSQASCLFSQRAAARVEVNGLQEAVNHWQKGEVFWQVPYDWAGDTLWDYPTREVGWGRFERLNKTEFLVSGRSMLVFDYVYLRDMNNMYRSLNDFLVGLLQAQGFSEVYNKAGIRIIQSAVLRGEVLHSVVSQGELVQNE